MPDEVPQPSAARSGKRRVVSVWLAFWIGLGTFMALRMRSVAHEAGWGIFILPVLFYLLGLGIFIPSRRKPVTNWALSRQSAISVSLAIAAQAAALFILSDGSGAFGSLIGLLVVIAVAAAAGWLIDLDRDIAAQNKSE
jgi:hypothetical protein